MTSEQLDRLNVEIVNMGEASNVFQLRSEKRVRLAGCKKNHFCNRSCNEKRVRLAGCKKNHFCNRSCNGILSTITIEEENMYSVGFVRERQV
jgi:hypothetical protein